MIVSVVYGGKEEGKASAHNAKDIAEALSSRGYTVHLIEFADNIISKLKELGTDVVYVCVQGKGYGDGTLQAILEHEKIPFTGSSMRAACLINDKILCKLLFDRAGIPTPKWDILSKKQYLEGNYPFENFGFPFLAKAPTQGASNGIEIIRSMNDIPRIENVFSFDDPIMLESFIIGNYCTVGFYERNGQVVTLPVVQFLYPPREDKIFITGQAGKHTVIKCNFPSEVEESILRTAEKVFEVTGAKGLARVDFMVDEKTHTPYVLEINAVPSLRRTSSMSQGAATMPQEAAFAGIHYEDMIEDILKSAEGLSNA
ncbi:MAG: ATP-grasp domain-containing protein [Synergistaceae bacterium]|nr:ATP-grasp domain-containing protein [Synergistaceae bacterium]